MAVPTITSITPSVGHTGGRDLVEIKGSGFQLWTVPPVHPYVEPAVYPTVKVLFGGSPGTDIAVISATRLYVRPPPSPLPVVGPDYGEGSVDVTVQNVLPDGRNIYGEFATLTKGFSYRRVQFADEPDYVRLSRMLVRLFRQQVMANVSISTHSDFDLVSKDMLNVVDVAEVPALVLFGPTLEENRWYATNGPVYYEREGYEADAYLPPDTDDLVFQFLGISEQKQEALAMQSMVRQFFKRNRYIYFYRDPDDLSKGYVRYDLVLDASSIPFNTPADEKSNLKSFSGSFRIRGFSHESLPGFPLSDRIERVHQVSDTPEPPDTSDPETPPVLASTKDIVDFAFPEGIGEISGTSITVRVPLGTDLTQLVPTITHNGVSVQPSSGTVQDYTQPVAYTVTAEDGTTKTYTVTVLFTQPTNNIPAMKIGTNFWYHTQRNLLDPQQENWSGEEAIVAGVNWATAYGTGASGLGAVNIWNPTWLAELGPYSTLRFMDWANTNWAGVTQWSERMLPTDPNNVEQYSDGQSTPPNPGMAYEWMIDLCNRLQKDFWVCIPHKANDDFVTQLAALIRDKLQSSRKVYVEYSNETWNGTFGQAQYTIDEGQAADLPPGVNDVDPTGRPYYQGQAFSVLRSIEIFEIFGAVFGPAAMGTRVIRTVCVGGNHDLMAAALGNIYQATEFNPDEVQIDLLAMAPYIGSEIDGNDPAVQSKFHQAIDAMFDPSQTDNFVSLVSMAEGYGIPAIGTYEGGQHLLSHAKEWTINPVVYDEYRYLLDRLNAHNCKLFMHYTHTGRWGSGNAWGAYDHTGQAIEEVHKYRAITDFLLGIS